MAYVLVSSSAPRSGDRYLIVREPSGYVIVLVNGQRPTSFHRHEASAFAWVARRELDRARARGCDTVGCSGFVFVNERGERRTIVCGTRLDPAAHVASGVHAEAS